ncbi:serine/threonine-protein kinase [Nitrosomonas communis]|uniref:Serine/threonine protein kinase n=1 Tax=Nitrosomonas communis TaxID=44574 RepID=A0A1H2Z8H6_9PROT|nr:serine/threonine-protein kinase [Nitrosomonas communis]SDX13636.1 Serine/threonine protein kinase [Nitrosomonas communis]
MTSKPPHDDSENSELTVASQRTLAVSSQETLITQTGENALPIGTTLEEFEIIGIIGWGGFGIVYLAYDHSLHRQVALKEYMPHTLAIRDKSTVVSIKSEQHKETFQAGLRSFINEARLLAHFDHPSLIKVYRFWESNGTAYMAMPFYQGVTLKETLHTMGTPPDEKWLRSLLGQLLDALSILHKDNCYHRDISPDNILILSDGRALLLDFGAARRVISDMTQSLTVILKPGYAPIEQYDSEAVSMTQGPWTDIYALAAVIYFAITGQVPTPSVSRLLSDPLIPLSKAAANRYSAGFLKEIDRALAVKPEDRPQNVDELRALLHIAKQPAEQHPYSVTFYVSIIALIAVAGISSFVLYELYKEFYPLPQPTEMVEKRQFDPVKVLDEIYKNRDPTHIVTVLVENSQARINKDELHFTIQSSKPGYVYLLTVGTGNSNFYLFFPNAVDKDNYIKSNERLALPREKWKLIAKGPAGANHFIAIVSNHPRDFTEAGLQHIDFFAEFPLEQARQLYHNYTGSSPLFAGKAICPPNSSGECLQSYGAAMFSIEETEE